MARDHFKYQAASNFAVRICKKVLKEGLPKGIVLNVNVPNLPQSKIKGYVITKQGKRDYGDVIEEKVDPRGRKYYWFGGDDAGFVDIPGSDCNAIHDAKISITPICANPRALPPLNTKATSFFVDKSKVIFCLKIYKEKRL